MKTLVLANQKGGVGKSAIATLLAHYSSQQGRRVLAIDFDHQGNFSSVLTRSGRTRICDVTSDQLMTQSGAEVGTSKFTLVPANRTLLMLERQPTLHTPFARNLRGFLRSADDQFDVCIIDTNPNPDIRVISALASADHVLSPVQLTMEAMEGVYGLLNHDRVGVRKIKAILNPKLHLIGILPSMVEETPFQRANLLEVMTRYYSLLIKMGERPGDFARMPRRSSVAEAQAEGAVLWEMKKAAARESWSKIESSVRFIANVVVADTAKSHCDTAFARVLDA